MCVCMFICINERTTSLFLLMCQKTFEEDGIIAELGMNVGPKGPHATERYQFIFIYFYKFIYSIKKSLILF